MINDTYFPFSTNFSPLEIFNKYFLSIFFSLLISGLFAQTAKEKTQIINTYDVSKLEQLSTSYKLKAKSEKRAAIQYAKKNNLKVRFEKDHELYELMKLNEEGFPLYYKTFNADAAISTRANYLHNGGGLGLNVEGQNMEAHIWDGGLARITHQEYDGPGGNNRFSIGDGSTSLHYHSAHVTGTIIASGVQSQAKGMAPQAYAIGYDWNSDISEATTAATNGMLVSNHSYGWDASSLPDWYFGAYIDESRDWDNVMYNAPYYLMIVAAGNDGNDNSSNGNPLDGNSAYDKLSGHATSKNNLVVASAQDAIIDGSGNLVSVTINGFSSEGPTDDYRIKPDITGNGYNLYSTYESSDTDYGTISGTSMASPNVTGSLLLLQQHYNNVNSSYMRAATLKGLALHTADDAGPAGPDAVYGWGLLNTKKAAETITQDGNESLIEELTLSQGSTFTIDVESDGVNPLMASISWTDPPGTANTGTANDNTPVLVNDLDIRVTQAANTYNPYKLTSITTNGTGDNIVDPYERVDVSGASGTYTITVTHKGSLSGGNQNFSLIVTGITYTGECTATIPTNIQATVIGSSSATIIWDLILGADYELRYREVGSPSWTTVSVSTSSYTITGLTELTDYEVQVRSICPDTTTSDWSASVFFTTIACMHCAVTATTDDDTGIRNVDFNTISNSTTGTAAYSDFTAISTDLEINNSYTLTVNVDTEGNYYVFAKAWIDWNQDCDFDDLGEEYDLGYAVNNDNATTTLTPSITVPVSALLGNTLMRVRAAYSDPPPHDTSPLACGNANWSEAEDYTVNIIACSGATKTWNGSAWSPSGVPDITNPVIIAGNYDTATNGGDIDCCSLTINNGATLIIGAGNYVNVKNNFENNGTIVVQDTGSLVQINDDAVNSGTGTYQIHKTTRPYTEYDYTFWSSPVPNETALDAFVNNSSLDTSGNTGGTTNGNQGSPSGHIYWFNTANFNDDNPIDNFDDDFNDWIPTTGLMEPGKGYIAMGAGADFPFNTGFANNLIQSVYFEDTAINNGEIGYSLSFDNSTSDNFYNENLVGNPYASAIDIQAIYNDPLNNPGGNPAISTTVQFWSHDNPIDSGVAGPWAYNFTIADYAIYNIATDIGTASNGGTGSLAPNRYWASCQSVFLEALQEVPLYFNNSMRVKNNNEHFFKTSEHEKDALWLNMTQENGLFRQIAIVFLPGGDDSVNKYDSSRAPLIGEPDFYSLAPNSENRLIIQGLAPFKEEKIISLGLEVQSAGLYHINIESVSGIFSGTQVVYLKDKKTNTLTELNKAGYTFNITDNEIGLINNRFEIHFMDANTVGVNETNLAELSIYPNPSADLFYFNWNSFEKLQIEVYNSHGQHLKTEWLEAGNALDMKGTATGIYYCVITSGKQQVQRKLIVW